MKCPSCAAELTYKERPNRVCPRCTIPFALEPRENSLGMSDLRMRGLAERVSEQGARRYTQRQLWHYACRQKLRPAKNNPCGVIVGVGGGLFLASSCVLAAWVAATDITGNTALGALAALIPFCLVVLLIWRWRRASIAPDMPISEHKFVSEIVQPWVKRYGELPLGMVGETTLERLRAYQPPPERTRAVLASPNGDVLDCLRANGLPEQIGLALLPANGPLSPEERQVLALLRDRPRLPLLLLHDASAAGCALARTLPAGLGLRSDRPVTDLGLWPALVKRHRLMFVRGDAPKELLGILERQAEAGGGLAREEIAWLRAGRVGPMLAIPPARLIAIVTRAVERLAPPDPEAQARAQAQAVGFLSWPQ